jgi:ketosteroid isomerase-like protein
MRKLVCLFGFLMAGLAVFAQSRQERDLVERAYLLSHTVFGTKDSLTTEDLFARKASYGHSNGKIETREEAIAAIVQNKAFYTDTAVSNMMVVVNGNVAIVRHVFKAKQNNPDGNASALNLHIMQTWVKERGKWRLMGRQAVRLSA